MSSSFKKSLENELQQQFLPSFPEYHAIQPFHPSAAMVLERSSPVGIRFFIVIATPPDRDEFTVELAWTRGATYPVNVKIQNPLTPSGEWKREAISGDHFRLRADRLWGMRRDFWWRSAPPLSLDKMAMQLEKAARDIEGARSGEAQSDLTEDAAPLRSDAISIKDLVRDAIQKIQAYGLPFFARVELDASRGPEAE